MNFHQESNRPSRFRPPLEGCVARDYRLATVVQRCYLQALVSIANHIYRSLILRGNAREVSELLEELAERTLEDFRTLGELLLALGGDAQIHRSARFSGVNCACRESSKEECLRETLEELQDCIDSYETVMGKTADRVVRSVFAALIGEKQRWYERIERFYME